MNENKELKEIINKIEFNKYPCHYPDIGLDQLNNRKCVLIETGGGGTAKNCLNYVAEHGGKVITLDLCTKPRTEMLINGSVMGDSGAGDYSVKKSLYEVMCDMEGLKPFWEYHNIDAYTFFKTYTDTIDFYYDDGTHHSKYLIPLFELVISKCNSDAVIGTHDKNEPEMKDFCTWIKTHPKVKEVIERGNSLIVKIK